jgi:hypothetical protein
MRTDWEYSPDALDEIRLLACAYGLWVDRPAFHPVFPRILSSGASFRIAQLLLEGLSSLSLRCRYLLALDI